MVEQIKKKTREEMEVFMEKLQTQVAGETVCFREYERFNIGGLPKTMSTLLKVQKAEAYMEASQDKMLTARQKIAIVTIMTITVLALIIILIARNMGLFNF